MSGNLAEDNMEEMQTDDIDDIRDKSLNIVVVHKDYPSKQIAVAFSEEIRTYVYDTIDKIPEGSKIPRIIACPIKDEGLLLKFSDVSSQSSGIKMIFDKFGSQDIKIVPDFELENNLYSCEITDNPGSKTDVLMIFARSNRDMDLRKWKCKSIRHVDGKKLIVFAVDSESAAIMQQKCALKFDSHAIEFNKNF